jgi:hypothetical protein
MTANAVSGPGVVSGTKVEIKVRVTVPSSDNASDIKPEPDGFTYRPKFYKHSKIVRTHLGPLITIERWENGKLVSSKEASVLASQGTQRLELELHAPDEADMSDLKL